MGRNRFVFQRYSLLPQHFQFKQQFGNIVAVQTWRGISSAHSRDGPGCSAANEAIWGEPWHEVSPGRALEWALLLWGVLHKYGGNSERLSKEMLLMVFPR